MQLITEFSTVKITEVMVSKKIKFLSHQNMMDLEGNMSVIALFAIGFVLTYAELKQYDLKALDDCMHRFVIITSNIQFGK